MNINDGKARVSINLNPMHRGKKLAINFLRITIQEAQKLNIPIFAMVDTNSDPNEVDFIIPSNDDASKSIEKILNIVCSAIKESLEERKREKEIDEQKKLEEAEAQSNADDTDASKEE